MRDRVADRTPERFANEIAERFRRGCASAYSEILDTRDANGYPAALWWSVCTHDETTGNSEHTYAKAIQGKDAFYVVQKAFRSAPAPDVANQWKDEFFRDVVLCDSRAPAIHPCPSGAVVFKAK
jgi:hypothetical protein